MRIVQTNKNEIETLKRFVEDDRQFKNYVEWRSNHHEAYEDDVADIYNYIKQSSPKIESPEEKPLLQNFLNSSHEDLMEMRQRSQGKSVLSYLATKAAAKLYDEVIDQELQRAAKDAAETAPEKRTQEQEKQLKKAKNSMRLGVRKRIDKFKKEFDDEAETLQVMAVAGSDPSSSPKELNMKDSMELLKKMKSNKSVKNIMNLAGKFQNLAQHKLMTKTDGNESIVGVKLGSDIPQLLPDELGLLVDDDFHELKELQMLQKQLFQYKSKAKKPKTGGPIVVCVDESGSMRGSLIEQAKAFLFGMWQVAKADKREMVVVRFGGTDETITDHIKSVDDLMRVVESFINSDSTCFESPLREASRVIENGGEFTHADIVFITDDGGSFSSNFLEDFNSFRKQTQTKVISLALLPYADNIKLFSDRVVYGYESLAESTF